MPLGPVADRRQVRAEALGDDVVGVADEDRPVADAVVAGDVLDHLGVVVGGQEGLVVAAVLHRQPAHEVGEPDVGGALELRVLVQVVVELPGLVADPEVVLLGSDEVMEDHEVRDQDLVHPPPGLEAVEIVLGGLRLDVVRLVGQMGARRMDALALGLEHPGHGILRQPVDLEIGMELAQLLGDRHVALRVAESDRRGDVERALAARASAARPGRAARRRGVDEVAQQQVDLHRVARLRAVSGALERSRARRRSASRAPRPSRGGGRRRRPVDHKHRAARSRPPARARSSSSGSRGASCGRHERLRRPSRAPSRSRPRSASWSGAR